MLIKPAKQGLIRPSTIWILSLVNKRSNSTTIPKLTSSYLHHVSSLPLIYKTYSQVFDETASKYPNDECYVFKSQQKRYTYQLFKDEVNAIAASLIELGFEKNDRIAVWLPNTSENVTMSFVASKLGLIKVNINPAYVGRELEYCINKVGCKGLLLSPSVKTINSLSVLHRLIPELEQQSSKELTLKQLPTLKHIILTGKHSLVPKGMHSYENLLNSGGKMSYTKLNERQLSVNPDSPASIFYTSGTTGKPKAATLTNFNIVNMSKAITDHLGKYFTCLCAPIPMFHIFSEMVGVLSPATLKCKIIFPAILPDPLATIRTIHEEKCTTLIGAPIIYRDILNHPDRQKYDLSSLEYGAIGASPVQTEFLRELEKELPIKCIGQVYGMTENTALLTSSMWTGVENQTRRHASIGRAMQGLELKVADSEGNPVPIGQSGEICARGYNIMAGYYGDSEKTQEAITSSRWLRTGDEGTMDEDGYLYFIGRRKEMIIRGGVNIYPIEIENVLVEHPSISEAQIFSIPDARHGEEICAWIKLKADAPTCQPEDIVEFLSDKIAFFKIPKHIRIVETFLMTPTGKVQKYKMSEAMANEINNKK